VGLIREERRKMREEAAAAEPGQVFRYEACSTTGKAGIMKLHEPPGKVIRQSGVSVLPEKRLAFMLPDFRAFEECPATRQVLEAIVEDGSGKWLKE